MTSPQAQAARQLAAYRQRVIAAHRPAFALHQLIATTAETAITGTTRAHPTMVHLVLDMFMIQASKTHAAVSIIAQHGMMEDCATLTRRLMELGVQAVYIGAESDAREQERRAGRYITYLWRQLPRRIKHRLPPPIRHQWTAMARRYAHLVSRKANKWGPSFFEMFRDIGTEKTYRRDYSLLSAIAHGSSDSQVFTYSRTRIRVHSHQFASALLRFASRYYLGVIEQWDARFNALPAGTLADLVKKVMKR